MTPSSPRAGLVESRDDGTPGDRVDDAHVVVRTALEVAAVLDVPVDVYAAAYDAVIAMENAEPLASTSLSALGRLCRESGLALARAIGADGRPSDGPEGGPIRAQAFASDSRGALDSPLLFDVAADGRVALSPTRIPLDALRHALPEVAAFLDRAAERGRRVSLVREP